MQATTMNEAVKELLAPVEAQQTEEVVIDQEASSDAETEQLDETEVLEVEEQVEHVEDDVEASSEIMDYEQDEDEADQVGPETHLVKVDGEEVSVTLDDLKRDFSGQAYIQKGMKQAAEKRKEAEQAFEDLNKRREQLDALIQQVGQDGILKQPTPPSAEMAESDPIGYIHAQAKFNEDLGRYQTQQAQLRQQQQEMQASQQRAIQAKGQQEAAELVSKVPEFGDPEKAKKIWSDLTEYGKSVGFSAQDIGAIGDHRQVIALRKAMLFDQMQANKGKAEAKVAKASPMVKPGAKKPANNSAGKKRQAQMSKLEKTGNRKDAVALMFQ